MLTAKKILVTPSVHSILHRFQIQIEILLFNTAPFLDSVSDKQIRQKKPTQKSTKNRYDTRRTDKQTDIRIDSQVTEIRIGTHKHRRVRNDIQKNDSPDTLNDSSMTERSMDQQLWSRFSIASDNDRKFVDAKKLDKIAGKELANKNRRVKILVSEMVDGTTLELDNFVRKKKRKTTAKQSFDCSSRRIMHMLILRGFKEIPRNEKRRNLVKFLFSETMLPE